MTTILRWYAIDALEQSALLLRQRWESGAAGWLEFALAASQFLLRDQSGAYWFLDVSTGEWHQHDQGGWRLPPNAAPGRLEGLQALAESGLLLAAAPGDFDDAFASQECWQPVEVLHILVERARQGYLAGAYSSRDIEALLGRLFLLDRQGRFWTLGFNSQQWQRFAEQGWVQVGHSPDPKQLVRLWGESGRCGQCGSQTGGSRLCPACGALTLQGLDELDQPALLRVHRFLLLGASTLPEPVTAPWQPPQDYPPPAAGGARCAVCGASSLAGSRYCSRCGARLGCPNCGATNPPNSRFCSHCGQSLQD
jgi:hypothetical protein